MATESKEIPQTGEKCGYIAPVMDSPYLKALAYPFANQAPSSDSGAGDVTVPLSPPMYEKEVQEVSGTVLTSFFEHRIEMPTTVMVQAMDGQVQYADVRINPTTRSVFVTFVKPFSGRIRIFSF